MVNRFLSFPFRLKVERGMSIGYTIKRLAMCRNNLPTFCLFGGWVLVLDVTLGEERKSEREEKRIIGSNKENARAPFPSPSNAGPPGVLFI